MESAHNEIKMQYYEIGSAHDQIKIWNMVTNKMNE